MLRLHMAAQEGSGVGWLYAVSDTQLGRAVAAIHADPGRRWTLSELASLAGMSRSVFFERFKRTVGSSPIEYLTRWRMLVAGERLRKPGETVATIAYSLGYESESAFSTAFKRVMARSPRQHKEQPSP